MAFKKLSNSLAAASQIPTQKRALSFMKPAALTQTEKTVVPMTKDKLANDANPQFFTMDKIMLNKEESQMMMNLKMQ